MTKFDCIWLGFECVQLNLIEFDYGSDYHSIKLFWFLMICNLDTNQTKQCRTKLSSLLSSKNSLRLLILLKICHLLLLTKFLLIKVNPTSEICLVWVSHPRLSNYKILKYFLEQRRAEYKKFGSIVLDWSITVIDYCKSVG